MKHARDLAYPMSTDSSSVNKSGSSSPWRLGITRTLFPQLIEFWKRTGDNRAVRGSSLFSLFFPPTLLCIHLQNECKERLEPVRSSKRALRRTGWEPVVRLLSNIVIRPPTCPFAIRFICATEIKICGSPDDSSACNRSREGRVAKGGKRIVEWNANNLRQSWISGIYRGLSNVIYPLHIII